MRRLVYLFLITFIYTNSVFAQAELNKYAYVLVPQQFEFQNNKDQFHLNSLTRHLFKDTGFNALYQEELGNLSRCDGLYADVLSTTNIFFTRLTVVLKNCYNEEVFRSGTGVSKEKDLRKGYHEALRNAFKSIEVLGVKQKDISSLEYVSLVNTKGITNEKIEAVPQTIEVPTKKTVKGSTTKYSYNEEDYFLEESNGNLILYKLLDTVNPPEEIGILIKTSRENMFVYNSKEINTLATFDANKNLIIDAVDSSGNVVQQVYKMQQ